jgi:hypothetical protein
VFCTAKHGLLQNRLNHRPKAILKPLQNPEIGATRHFDKHNVPVFSFMKKLSFPAIAINVLILTFAAFGQNERRPLDNFDIAGGVTIYRPAPAPTPSKTSTKKKPGTRYQVVVEDKLVRQTASVKPTASVTDSLAVREGAKPTLNTPIATNPVSFHLRGFTTGNEVHDSYIVEFSRRYNIDPLLIYSQMHQESSFKIRATSPKGASGLMQLMPATARRFGVTSIYDPKQNIEAGIRYMRWLLDTFNGDVVLALAGYNAGEGAVMKYGWQVPPYRETQEYVRRITERYSMITGGRFVASQRLPGMKRGVIAQKAAPPLTIFQPAPLAVRLPDGKMILVNQ